MGVSISHGIIESLIEEVKVAYGNVPGDIFLLWCGGLNRLHTESDPLHRAPYTSPWLRRQRPSHDGDSKLDARPGSDLRIG